MKNYQLIQLLELLKTDVINSIQANGKYATGQTSRQITITEDGNNVQLQFPDYMLELEMGRRPTSKNAVPGDPPMIQQIQQWCAAKGIPDKAAWAIKKSIDKKGHVGKQGILTEPLSNENINLRLNPVLENIASVICEELLGLI
jgi:hypothetical protein